MEGMKRLFGVRPTPVRAAVSHGENTLPPSGDGLPDAGVIPVFRAFIWIRLGFTVLPELGRLVIVPPMDLSGPFGFGPLRFISLITLLILLLYLHGPRLPEKLGRAYLPLAVLIATVEPLISQSLLINLVDSRIAVIGGAWSLFPILFAPLVLIAWQYNFRTVFLYVLGTTLLDLALSMRITVELVEIRLAVFAAMSTRVVTMLIAGYLIVQLMKIQRAQRTALQKANADLQGYLVTQEQLTTSRERNRLARELHDTLAHTLSMLAVQLEATKVVWDDNPAEAHTLLDQSLEATRAGLTETRRALQALRASPLEDLGLMLALQSLADSVSVRYGFQIDVQLPDGLPALTPLAEQTLYRTAQESLANIAQHADATHAALHLTHAGHTLILTISDNGRGFDPAAIHNGHFGLRGLQERAEMTGGTLGVESTPGVGTNLKLTIKI